MIGIVASNRGFSNTWVKICEDRNLDYSIIKSDKSSFIRDTSQCDIILWNWYHDETFNSLFAKKLNIYLDLFAKKKIYPSFNTIFHYDDKIIQSYLIPKLGLPYPRTEVFFNYLELQKDLKNWEYPVVLKTSSGAGSYNVKKIETKSEAKKYINKVFDSGLANIDRLSILKDELKSQNFSLKKFSHNLIRLIFPSEFERKAQRQFNHVIKQEYLPNNSFDIRVIIVFNKAIGLIRYNRKNDFRASGSGMINFDYKKIPTDLIDLSFQTAEKMQMQTIALDFIKNRNNEWTILETSYAFSNDIYLNCPGYWDKNKTFHKAEIKIAEWILDGVLEIKS